MLISSLTIAMAHIVVLASPGSDFFFVSQTTTSRPRKGAMAGVLGITCGTMVWVGIMLLGLHLIIEEVAWLHALIMVDDGLYLRQMGYQILRDALKKEVVSAPTPQVELVKNGRSFLKSLLTNPASPKAIIYFGSVLSLFIGNNVGTTGRWGAFALIIVGTLAWFTVIVGLSALPQIHRGYQCLTKWIDGSAGVLFAGFDICLVISR